MVFQDRRAGALAKAVRTIPGAVPCRSSFRPRGVTMRDRLKNRAGFDRVLMAVAATFLTVSATSALAQADAARNGAAELAIDAAIPRPEPANVPPPTASDFKPDSTALAPEAAKTAEKGAEGTPSGLATAPAADTGKAADTSKADSGKNDTAAPAIAPAAAAATPAAEPAKEPVKEPVQAASNVAPADQPVADRLREMLGAKSMR